MFEQRVRHVMRRRNLLTAAPGISVTDGAQRMAKKQVGAIVVVEKGKLIVKIAV